MMQRILAWIGIAMGFYWIAFVLYMMTGCVMNQP
jgi:hypothetical protein